MCGARNGSEAGAVAGDTYTTFRPPYQPVTLAALAGRERMPFKRTPLDRIHRDLGARMVESRPVAAHLTATASPPMSAPQFASEWASSMSARWANWRSWEATLGNFSTASTPTAFLICLFGRIRYGLMTSDNGVILDDGTVTRLADDRYFVTTTSGNADVSEEWFNGWNAGAGNGAYVVNVTAGYGAVNVAGPRARETLAKLTGIDLTPRGFRYMRGQRGETSPGSRVCCCASGSLARPGGRCTSPPNTASTCGRPSWTPDRSSVSLPFGLEAQRVLRLEKGHVIVGQDTDAVSTPMDVGSDWAVRFDKPEFIGRGGLVVAAGRGLQQRLVGFVMPGASAPEDGTPVLSGARPVGRVTSARISPTMERGFGLAWVPPYLAVEGESIEVLVADRPVTAQVTLEPVYDPEGIRLRS